MNEYMYLMPPTLEPEISGGEEYEEDDEQEQEIVEEEGIIDPSEMMNIVSAVNGQYSVRNTVIRRLKNGIDYDNNNVNSANGSSSSFIHSSASSSSSNDGI